MEFPAPSSVAELHLKPSCDYVTLGLFCFFLFVPSCLRPRVRFGVDFLQARHTGMRVDLRRGQVGMAQQLLHGTQIGAGVQQVCRVGMSQLVR